MKKFICLTLVALMPCLSACNAPTAETTVATTTVTQSAEEAKVFKALLIGQSLGQDTVWLLQQVLKAEMPDQEFLVGDIYLSVGLDTHRKNILDNAAVYDYTKFDDNGFKQLQNISIEMALKDEMWDLIIFNDTTYYTTQPAQFQDGDHDFMINYIRETAAPGCKLAYNATWANPTSALLWGNDRRDVPAVVHERFANEFGGSRNEYYNRICENIKTYIETNEAYDLVFHTGTAMQYASETYGVPEGAKDHNYELYRDYVHASDFGRLLVAYQLYAQIYGLEKLEAVNVNTIEAKMRFTSEQKYGDIEITQQHKDAIIASVNFALAHPNEVPPQTAREPAFLERPDLMTAQN